MSSVVEEAIRAARPSDPQAARAILEALAPSGLFVIPARTLPQCARLGVGSYPAAVDSGPTRVEKIGGVILWPGRVSFYGPAVELLEELPADLVARFSRVTFGHGAGLSWGRATSIGGGARKAPELTGCPRQACQYAHAASVACEDA